MLINATACYLHHQGKTLFLHRKRGKEDIHNDKYVPAGGHTERGERGIDCIIREFRQETGLTLINPRLRAIVTFYNKERKIGDKKDPDDWCVEFYEASQFKGKLRAEKGKKAKPVWINDHEIFRLPMHQGDRELIELMRRTGVYEVLARYKGEELIQFDYRQVA